LESASNDPVAVYVWGDEMTVTLPGSNFKAVYHRPANPSQQLISIGSPIGTTEFKARAWWGANRRARAMGWIE
jgi:hypothetical protein